MEVKISEKIVWRFPCKGISKSNRLVVGFSKQNEGAVLDIGDSNSGDLYKWSTNWNMNNFEPLLEEKQSIDWDKVELPTLLFDRKENRNLFFVERFNIDTTYIVRFYDLIENKKIEWMFSDITKRNEFLNTLEVYPKGTKIEITL